MHTTESCPGVGGKAEEADQKEVETRRNLVTNDWQVTSCSTFSTQLCIEEMASIISAVPQWGVQPIKPNFLALPDLVARCNHLSDISTSCLQCIWMVAIP